jgi:hypothetical protein
MAALPRSWIDALFLRFSSYYGEQFISKWKHTDIEQTKNDWAEALWKYDREILKVALEYCREESKYPPSLPEFVQMCKNARPIAERHALLDHKWQKSENSKELFAGIKKMLEKGKA